MKETEHMKFLGLQIDSNFTWDQHVDYICNKISSSIFLLRQLSKFCTLDVLKKAYYGLVYSHLNYGISIWGNCSKSRIMRIFILQKSAIRILAKLSNRETCRNAFKELNILTLPSMYIYQTILFCLDKCPLIKGCDIHKYNTRTNNLIRNNQHRLEIYNKLPSQAGVKLYNNLPESIKNSKSFKQLKFDLKEYLVSKVYYSVEEFMESSHTTES